MSNERIITRILPTVDRKAGLVERKPAKKRVAAYARVSTDLDEQINSYEAQVDYYTKYIRNNSEWEFVRMYAEANFFLRTISALAV
jgi:predicted site-specific integrase-resolvase